MNNRLLISLFSVVLSAICSMSVAATSKKEIAQSILSKLRSDEYLQRSTGSGQKDPTAYAFEGDYCTLKVNVGSTFVTWLPLAKMVSEVRYAENPYDPADYRLEIRCEGEKKCARWKCGPVETGFDFHPTGSIGSPNKQLVTNIANELNYLRELCGGRHKQYAKVIDNPEMRAKEYDKFALKARATRGGNFRMWAGMPERDSDKTSWAADCEEGGKASVYVRHRERDMFCWAGFGFSGATARCDINIGVEAALTNACRGE